MNKHRLLAVVGALALLSFPAAAQASQLPPGTVNVPMPLIDGASRTTSFVPSVSSAPAAVQTGSHVLTPAEIQYHRATVEHMQHAATAAAGPALQVHPLTAAELQYHRDTVLHMNLR